LHPSRRLRTLALAAHSEFLRADPLREQMFFYIREVASAEQVESVLGSWCMATRDPERQVALVALRSWDAHVTLTPAESDPHAGAGSVSPRADERREDEKLRLDATQMSGLLTFVQRALLDPLALHAFLNPVQVPVDISVPKTVRGRLVPPSPVQTRRVDAESAVRVKAGESEEESEADRKGRLRSGALGALQWILGTYALYSS